MSCFPRRLISMRRMRWDGLSGLKSSKRWGNPRCFDLMEQLHDKFVLGCIRWEPPKELATSCHISVVRFLVDYHTIFNVPTLSTASPDTIRMGSTYASLPHIYCIYFGIHGIMQRIRNLAIHINQVQHM